MTVRCKATSGRRSTPCQAYSVRGGDLCHVHGGKATTPTEAVEPARPSWDQPGPPAAMRRALAVAGNTVADERWVTLRSVRVCNSDAYVVAVVDGRNIVTDWRSLTLTPDLTRARTAANRLYDRTSKEH